MKRLLAAMHALCCLPLYAGDVELGESDQAAIRFASRRYARLTSFSCSARAMRSRSPWYQPWA